MPMNAKPIFFFFLDKNANRYAKMSIIISSWNGRR